MLQIGSIYFQFSQESAYRPKRQFVHLRALDQPEQELQIEILDRDSALSPKEIEPFLRWAVDRAWGREAADCWKLQQRGRVLTVVEHLIRDERVLAEEVRALQGGKPLAAFEQQQNWQELEQLGEDLGLQWPSAWQQLYIYNSVDGGWGPDAGFFPLFPTTVHQHNIKSSYQHFQKDHPAHKLWRRKDKLVPFLHWGTDVYSLLDTSTNDGAVYSFDLNLKQEDNRWEDCLWKHQESLYQWMKFWMESEDYGLALWRNMYEQKGML